MASFESLVSTINEKDIRKREDKIIEYVRSHREEIVENNYRIDEFAQKAGVGYSAFYNLMKKIGINGYKEMMTSISTDYKRINKGIDTNDETELLNAYESILKNTEELLPAEELVHTIDLILEAERVFFIAWETTILGAARELYNYYYTVKSGQVWLIDSDQETLDIRVNNAKKGDLFIFFSRYGTSSRMQKSIQDIYEDGAQCIYISTIRPSSKILPYIKFSHTIISEDHVKKSYDKKVSKLLSFIYLTDALINLSDTRILRYKGKNNVN